MKGTGQPTEIMRSPAKVLLARLGWASALLVTSVAVSIMVSGCGNGLERESSRASNTSPGESGARTYRMPDAEVARVPSPASETATGAIQAENDGAPTAGSMESWPPDLAMSLSDTVAAPGQVVEVVAEATSDVVEIALRDGIGQSEPFVFDQAQGVWRATYRVPLKPHWERTGLSVTAKNDAGRWRRVWVFVRTGTASPEASTNDLAQQSTREQPAGSGDGPLGGAQDRVPERDDF